MAKRSDGEVLEKLRKSHADAAYRASVALEETIRVADTAVADRSDDARKLLKKQEAKASKAAERWRRSADDLRKHLRQKQA
jgi:hypothetical protein